MKRSFIRIIALGVLAANTVYANPSRDLFKRCFERNVKAYLGDPEALSEAIRLDLRAGNEKQATELFYSTLHKARPDRQARERVSTAFEALDSIAKVDAIERSTYPEADKVFKALDPFVFSEVKIPKGTVRLPEDSEGEHDHITITHDLFVSATQVTQGEFYLVTGGNPSRFSTPDFDTTGSHLEIQGSKKDSKIGINPNHPVEQVNWWSMLYFANEKSKLEGLDPAIVFPKETKWRRYDDESENQWRDSLSIEWLKQAAADGVLVGDRDPEFNLEANGYRPMTEAEWEYIARKTGELEGRQSTDSYSFGDDPSRLPKFGWHNQNSDHNKSGQTHPVATLEPVYGIFDLHGNVWEWGLDGYDFDRRPTGTDPKGLDSGEFRVIRGGSWNHNPENSRSGYRDFLYSSFPYYFMGGRLVRTASE